MSESLLWVERFAPASLDAFCGNAEAVKTVKQWALDWQNGKMRKPLLLHGPTGTGKTTLAHLFARHMKWTVFELNASDFRTKDVVERLVGGAAFNAGLVGGLRLVVLDEVDGIQGREDKGGIQALLGVIKEARNPLLLTANDIYADKRLAPLRSACELVGFSKVNYLSIARVLREVCDSMKVDYDVESVTRLAKNCGGDLRAALLDAQMVSLLYGKIVLEDVSLAGGRERSENIFSVIRGLLRARSLGEARALRFRSEVEHDLLKKWLEENLPRHYQNVDDHALAWDQLSKADVFDGRIMRRQQYGFMRYSAELAGSVNVKTREEVHGFVAYQFPSLLRQLSGSMGVRKLRKDLAKKVGGKTHASVRTVLSSDLAFLKMLMQNRSTAVALVKYFDLNEDEVAFLLDSKPETKKVQSLVNEAKGPVSIKEPAEVPVDVQPLISHPEKQVSLKGFFS
ncbi:MAG: replication factor C large subunit [Candidatus Diapherotrites archaeon]|nr:replication factor C large subunit [Candidatus Diapherotrites archaeon]